MLIGVPLAYKKYIGIHAFHIALHFTIFLHRVVLSSYSFTFFKVFFFYISEPHRNTLKNPFALLFSRIYCKYDSPLEIGRFINNSRYYSTESWWFIFCISRIWKFACEILWNVLAKNSNNVTTRRRWRPEPRFMTPSTVLSPATPQRSIVAAIFEPR